ncbi:MAG: hypothetical protein F6K14_11255 [Symploca sp. SIO2C1]|nr:hypothetical protein [Symploca sp. SIO2C1]
MKGKVILGSILLGLNFPLTAFGSIYTQISPSAPRIEEFNSSGTVEIAQQRYLSYQFVSSRLYSSQSRILSVAREFSGSKVKWKSISVEEINTHRLKLNLYGKVPVGGALVKDSKIRIGLFLQRDSRGSFRFVDYDFRVWGGTFPGKVRKKARKKLEKLPDHFPRFQQEFDRIVA